MKDLLLKSNQIQSFFQQGFVVIKNFYDPSELGAFEHALRKLICAGLRRAGLSPSSYIGKEFDEGLLALEHISHEYVADIYDAIAQTPAFLRLVVKPEISRAANRLLEKKPDDVLYTFTCRCRIDPPHDRRRTYGWHQEVFYTVPKSRFVQTWAPLIRDTTIENGTIEVCPGSHREKIAPQTWHEKPGYATQILVRGEVVNKYKPLKIPMELGDLLIFDAYLFHQSGQNTSDQVRYSLVGMYHDVDFPSFRAPGINFLYKEGNPSQYFEEQMRVAIP